MEELTARQRARGCLIGTAAGDALGFPVEFSEDYFIFDRYGERGITEYVLCDGVACVSDDTQMTLFTAEGLLQAESGADVKECAARIYGSYLNWLLTQRKNFDDTDECHKNTPLMRDGRLYSRRAPGATCISALSSGVCGSVSYKINDSKGCGGVMRVSPIALCGGREGIFDDETTAELGAEAAAITHGHPLGYIPAAVLVFLLRRIMKGEPIYKAVVDAVIYLRKRWQGEFAARMEDLLLSALSLSECGADELECILQLGAGWVGEECLAIGVFCALKYSDDFARGLIAAVNHGGDSDSTGAVAGAILGAYLGEDAIPPAYKKSLELYDLLFQTAEKLCDKRR